MHDSEQEHSSITGCRVTYESTIFYNEANKFSICEAKYYAQPMTLDEIHREVQQAEAIKELTVKQIGFIAINGFVEREEPYFYLDGNDIFANE